MNSHTQIKALTPVLSKNDASSPAIFITDGGVVIKSATVFNERKFLSDTPVDLPTGGLIAGSDYVILVGEKLAVVLAHSLDDINDPLIIGGFHLAPGGNATARKGGDDTPTINPYSLWDRNFRPACADPRGMALVEKPGGRFWCDIYLLGVNHLSDGTSRLGVQIADGDTPPMENERAFDRLDYETAKKVMAFHGKQLLGFEDFAAVAYGVTERTAIGSDPDVTKLDAARTSKFGIMQATGNMWVWGHDGDPDEPRASLFGGSWWGGGNAGSRYAGVGYWADVSDEDIGARGRSDHLQLG